MLALIDADIICYNVGYTTEDDPVEVAYSRVDEFISNIILVTGATDYVGYLSDSAENNFRYKIDPSYKANRIQPKPKWYNEIKEYLIVKHGAKIAYGMETDDMLGILQTEANHKAGVLRQGYPTIIASIDKDLQQIDGYHYSWPIWRKGEIVREWKVFKVTKDEGLRFFYSQLLIGDVADNIQGIDGLGEKRTAKLFDGVPTENLYDIVVEKYEEQYSTSKGFGWGEWITKLVNNSKLLWIKRTNEENEETPVEARLKLSLKETSLWETVEAGRETGSTIT